MKKIKRAIMWSALSFSPFLALKANAIEFTYNGFASLVGGSVIKAEENHPSYLSFKCPCFITDYNQDGLYEDGRGFSFKPESRAGLQGSVVFNDSLSLTAQGIVRSVDMNASLEWLYLTYAIDGNWSFSVGRKRLPLYFYSEFQDVGNAYIFIRPPQTLYGWDVSNFNGGDIRYQNVLGDVELDASVFFGEEEQKDSEYQRIYSTVSQDVKWKNIVGATVQVTHDWLTARLMHMETDTYITENSLAQPNLDQYGDKVNRKISGLALNAEFDRFFILSEYNLVNRYFDAGKLEAVNYSLGSGLRLDNWTLFVNYSKYADNENNKLNVDLEIFSDKSITLKYNIADRQDIKLQLDEINDQSTFNFVGDTRLVSIAYNLVF